MSKKAATTPNQRLVMGMERDEYVEWRKQQRAKDKARKRGVRLVCMQGRKTQRQRWVRPEAVAKLKADGWAVVA